MNDEKNMIDQNFNEESVVSDLKDSLDMAVKEASHNINQLIENLETNIQDKEIDHETKKILNNISEELRNFAKLTSKSFANNKIKKSILKEEE